MKHIALIAIGLTGLALSGCASRYYDDGYYDRYGHYYGHVEYTDRDRYNDPYYSSRDYDQVRPYRRY